MLLERNQTVIGLVVVVLVAIGTVLAVGATAGLFVDGEPMSAEFTDAAGLEEGDFVYVGGHRAGTVTGVRIDGDHVDVDFTLTAPQMPADSMAEITLASALGRRGLSIVPGSSTDTLAAGDVIPIERTTTPVDLPELGDRSAALLGGVDVDAMQELTTALADITEGSREDVEALLEGVERVSGIVTERRAELEAVLDRAHVVVDAVADQDAELVALIDDFGAVLERLVERRADITRLLRETADTSTMTAELVAERREQIDRVLASFSEDLALVDRHQVDLAHTMAYLAASFGGFSSIGYSGGEARVDNPDWGNVFVTNLGSIGVGALLECGGALDQLFTDLLGPDPRCSGTGSGPQTQGPEQGPPAEDAGRTGASPGLPSVPNLDPLVEDVTERLTDAEALGRFLQVPVQLLADGDGGGS